MVGAGGGCDKGAGRGVAAYLALKYGLVYFSIDYRLSGEARFPAQSGDVRCAIGYVRSKAAGW